ncbi:MAG: tRNA lysidine(34) synthetase TilS [Rhodobacteraceae bacterium]|nr:tRNA lysidine(34) synthetase TilS [Paracoccaceae bacterium]
MSDTPHPDWIDDLRAALPAGTRHLGLAVSGGGDSMALLSLATRAFSSTDVRLSVVTVDHGLRDGVEAEIALAAAVCSAANLRHEVLAWEGRSHSGNLQDGARQARYRLIAEWANAAGVEAVALGHTKDDLAETFLMRLGRASGLDGLSAMAPRFERHGCVWLRPLLTARREDLRTYLRANDLRWADDPTNDDARFMRVRARAALGALKPLEIDTDAIATSAKALREARAALDEVARQDALSSAAVDGGDVILRRNSDVMPTELRRRILVAALRWVGQTEYPPRASAVAELESQIAAGNRHTINGCLVSITDQSIRIGREQNAVKDVRSKPNSRWDGRWTVTGPRDGDVHVAVLGEGIKALDTWRDTGFPRDTLIASPAVWRGQTLVSAPLAGFSGGYAVQSPTLQDFVSQAFVH